MHIIRGQIGRIRIDGLIDDVGPFPARIQIYIILFIVDACCHALASR